MNRIYKKFITSFKMQLKRRYLLLLKKEAIANSLARRRGECLACGECCRASFDCPFLYKQGDRYLCRIHETKPEVCKIYPFSEDDMFPHTRGKCGYYFVDSAEDENNENKDKEKNAAKITPTSSTTLIASSNREK